MASTEAIAHDGTPTMFTVNAPMLVTGGTFNQYHHNNTIRDPRKVIHKAFKRYIAYNATNDSIDVMDPPRCHPKTRLAILRKLGAWASSTKNCSYVLWLFGPAGAGKSAIARSLAELLANENRLGATFYFLRTADMRNNARFLISTLAYNLTLAIPDLIEFVSNVVENNADIFQQSLETQMERLIIEPVLSLGCEQHRVLIIDGLDECADRDVQCRIIKLIANAAARLNGKVKFLVFSRQEYHIEATFKLPTVNDITFTLNLKDDLDTFDDILMFLWERFEEIKRAHPLHDILVDSPWPIEEDVDELVRRSSGNFIYPQTVMKYIEAPYDRPQNRLQAILELSAAADSPYAELDCLYHHILSSSRADRFSLLRILGTMAVFRGDPQNVALACSTRFQEKILSLSPGDISLKLLDLRSLITFESYIPARPYITFPSFHHTSLFDFLLDSSRSKEFYIDMDKTQIDLTIGLLSFLENSILKLSDPIQSRRCDCTSELLCDHKWFLFYNALDWISSSPSVELQDVIMGHNIAPLYDLILADDGENNIEKLSGALAIPILYLGVLEFLTSGERNICTKHHSDYEQFLTRALNKYHDKDSILDTILSLVSTLGSEEFSFTELDLVRRCISILLLYHPSCSLQGEEQSTLLLEINAALDLRVRFQTVIDALKPTATGHLYKALLFTERAIPFNNEYSAARHLARFLVNEDKSGKYHCDDNSIRRAIVYCLDFLCARFEQMLDNLHHFCEVIGKLLVLQLYRQSPRIHHLRDGRTVYLPKSIRPSISMDDGINELITRFLSLTRRYCEIASNSLDIIGLDYAKLEPTEFGEFWNIGWQAFLTLSGLEEPIEDNPATPCLITRSQTITHDLNSFTIVALGQIGMLKA